jgi:hypothetical protein
VPATEQPETPVDVIANFPNLTPDFCRELVGDLTGVAQAIEDGRVNQLDYLNFIMAHLKKINDFKAS